MKFIKENLWVLNLIMFHIIIISVIGYLSYIDTKHYNEWYDSLTPAEKEIHELQKQQVYESRIQRYDVVGVNKYVKNTTNTFGDIIEIEICYSFAYIDGDKLCHVDNFRHLEYGLTKITIGDKDLYIVNNNGETTRTLQLTKETLSNMQILN